MTQVPAHYMSVLRAHLITCKHISLHECLPSAHCTQRDCMLPLNRDKNGATNIGTNFARLLGGKVPIRSMNDEDLAFHRASICLECE